MKKVILQYLASALAVILILGLVVFNRQRNHSLVKKVKDPEISYIYQDSLENIDRLALSQAGVIQSYQLGMLCLLGRKMGKIYLVRPYQSFLWYAGKSCPKGRYLRWFICGSSDAIKGFKAGLGGRVLSETLDLDFTKGRCYYGSWPLGSGH